MGQEPEGPLCMQYERESGQDVSSPKHGKVSTNFIDALSFYVVVRENFTYTSY